MTNDNQNNSNDEFSINDHFNNLIALLPGHVYWKDLNCRFLGCNDLQAKDINLADRKDVVGLSAYDAIVTAPDEETRLKLAKDVDDIDKKVMATGQSITIEEPLIQPDGSERTFLSQKIPLKNDVGQVVGLLGCSVEITKQVEAELIATRAKKELEALNQLKQTFLANMRHDIRTPFSGILASAQLLADTENDPIKKEHLQNIATGADVLLHYLNEILEFTAIDEGHIPVMEKPFNLRELLDDCINMFKVSASHKKLALKVMFAQSVSNWIIGDRFRIQRILINLISNAVKFTDSGQIDVGIDIVKTIDDHHGILKFWVKDTGRGIPPEKQHVIFEKFETVDPAYKTTNQSIGLGLGTVRQLVQALNGNIYLKSTEGQGTLFSCVIPYAIPLVPQEDIHHLVNQSDRFSLQSILPITTLYHSRDTKEQHANKFITQNHATKHHILVVEDGPLAAKVLAQMLEHAHFTVTIAETGEEAVTLSEHAQFDFIFMDIGLPGIDGIETTRRIRQHSHHGATPIVALTAHAVEDIQQEAKEAGMHDIVAKPFKMGMVDGLIKPLLAAYEQKIKSEYV